MGIEMPLGTPTLVISLGAENVNIDTGVATSDYYVDALNGQPKGAE